MSDHPLLTREQIAHALETGRLEAAANAEYYKRGGNPGPALRALNEHRRKPWPTETRHFDLAVCP